MECWSNVILDPTLDLIRAQLGFGIQVRAECGNRMNSGRRVWAKCITRFSIYINRALYPTSTEGPRKNKFFSNFEVQEHFLLQKDMKKFSGKMFVFRKVFI